MKRILIFALSILIIIGCKTNTESFMTQSKEMNQDSNQGISGSYEVEEELLLSPPQSMEPQKRNADSDLDKGNKIIKNGNMHIEVEKLAMAKTFIDSVLYRNDGYYASEDFKKSDYAQKYMLNLRVPTSNFNKVVASLEQGGGLILEKNVTAKDVTEEYLDLEIRLETNRAYLNRYTELLTKAKNIKEILEIQEKIRDVEMLIDGNIGRMRYLNDRVKYSSLRIVLSQKPEEILAETPPTFIDNMKDAFKNGFSGLLSFILVLANLWPILVLFILIWAFRSKLLKRLFPKRSFKQMPSENN